MELLLNDCSITYIPKDSKKKKHELKISHQGADALVLAVQSKEQAEQWLKVMGILWPGVFLPTKCWHCSVAVTNWGRDGNFHINPDHLKSHLTWDCRNTDFKFRPQSNSAGLTQCCCCDGFHNNLAQREEVANSLPPSSPVHFSERFGV